MVKKLSDSEILAQIPAARRRALKALRAEPHAKGVRYSRRQRLLHIELTNGAAFAIPIELIPGLDEASDRALSDVSVGPAGVGIRLERLDADLSVASLARMAFGPAVLLSAAGAAGGASRTNAKARAARVNGLRGGRPRKTRRKTAA
jgi:hypothetical protein